MSIVLLWVAWGGAEEIPRNGGLGALERRAVLAQALVQQVETLKAQIEELRGEMDALNTKIGTLQDDIRRGEEERAALQKSLKERDEQIAAQKEMLAVLRNGSFEYYEVREGDTLQTIAANPIVYGDASRSALIGQANDLSNTNELSAGTILIIPRYPEGVLHDL